MFKPSRLIRLVLASALMLAAAGVGSVSAYEGETVASITMSGPTGTLKCNTWYTIRATLRDSTGKVIFNHTVLWNIVLKLSSRDTISPVSSKTNGLGVATTRVKLACVAGPRTVRARADDEQGLLVLPLTSAGLPRTSTIAPADSQNAPLGWLALTALGFIGGAAFVSRRQQGTRH